MEWKKGAELIRGDGVWITIGDKKKKIEEADLMIVELMEKAVTDDDELLRKVAEDSCHDEYVSGLRLAQFVEDYGEFLAEGKRAKVFGA